MRKLLFITVALFALTLLSCKKLTTPPTTQPSTLSNGLIAYYSFNGNAKDSTNNHLDGTVYGATLITDRFGNTNSAYSFNMNGDSTDYIDVPNDSLLEPDSSISISAWVWISSTDSSNFERILSKQQVQAQNYASYQLIAGNETQDSLGYAGLTLRTTTSYNWTGHSGISFIDKWVNICGTWDGSNMKFYQNGVLTANIPQSGKILYDNEDLWIGKGFDGLGYNLYFKGYIDDIRIYNRAIDSTEIAALYHQTN